MTKTILLTPVFESQNPFKNNSIDIFSNETNKPMVKKEEPEISFPDFFRNNELTKGEQVFWDNYGFSHYSHDDYLKILSNLDNIIISRDETKKIYATRDGYGYSHLYNIISHKNKNKYKIKTLISNNGGVLFVPVILFLFTSLLIFAGIERQDNTLFFLSFLLFTASSFISLLMYKKLAKLLLNCDTHYSQAIHKFLFNKEKLIEIGVTPTSKIIEEAGDSNTIGKINILLSILRKLEKYKPLDFQQKEKINKKIEFLLEEGIAIDPNFLIKNNGGIPYVTVRKLKELEEFYFEIIKIKEANKENEQFKSLLDKNNALYFGIKNQT